MQYTRLIGSLIDECIAASLGGYDVEDVISQRATGGDLIREILVKAVCDPRFKSTMRVAKGWQDDAQDLLEDFAQGLLDTRGLTREDAFNRMEDFLARYFFTMIQGVSSPNMGHDLVSRGGGKYDGPASGDDEGDEGGEKEESDEGKASDAQKSKELGKALKEMDEGPEEMRRREQADNGSGNGAALSREEEQKVELRFLRSIPSSLKKLAKLIGRSGNDDMIPSGHYLTASKSDIAGITVGDDLSNLLPSEVAMLASPQTQDIFFRNFVGKRLQVFASASAGCKAPVTRQDGPVVICLDRSSSMIGHPSDIARALTMAVTIIAKRQHREVIVVKYGNEEQSHFVVKNLRRQRKDFIRFLTYGCAGGNNEDTMFGWVFGKLLPKEKEFDSADVLCVSDFGWAPVSNSVMELINANKAKGMKFYGLDVSGEGIRDFKPADWMGFDEGAFPPEIIDSMWIWNENRHMCYEENQNVKRHGKIR